MPSTFSPVDNIPVISDVTAAEVLPAPRFVRELHAEMLALSAEVVGVSEEAISLASSYEARIAS